MVFDFGDRGEGYLNDLAISAFYLYARGCECLSGFHAPDDAPHALAINSYNFDIVFAVQRLKSRKCFSDFHDYPSEVRPFRGVERCQTLEILHWKTADVYVA
jgi:hypothetical protein